MKEPTDLSIVVETKYLRLARRGHWDFVQRTTCTGVVVITAVTNEQHLLLIEQYRPPVDARVIELPAGLSGDIHGEEDESFESAARRELLEETGYRAGQMERLATVASTPGLSDELMTFFKASDLTREHEGGGDESEDIQVHTVPVADVDAWLDDKANGGCRVAAPVYSGLYLLRSARA